MGRIDLVVTQNGAETKLYRNARGRPGLRVRLNGPPGNPRGIGAQMRLQFGVRQGPMREAHAGSGYWSQDSAVQVLATPEPPSSIWIRWPAGKVTTTPILQGLKKLKSVSPTERSASAVREWWLDRTRQQTVLAVLEARIDVHDPAVMNPRPADRGGTLDPHRQQRQRTGAPHDLAQTRLALSQSRQRHGVRLSLPFVTPAALNTSRIDFTTGRGHKPARPADHEAVSPPKRQRTRGLAHSTTWRKPDWPSRSRDSVVECGAVLCRFNASRFDVHDPSGHKPNSSLLASHCPFDPVTGCYR